ncbi:MAG: Rossmann-like fold-containing protein [Parachlamydiaceae bacterium]
MLPTCSGNHKMRLFIGEGNFTYTEAFIEKHNRKYQHGNDSKPLANSIIATELASRIHCSASCKIVVAMQPSQPGSSGSRLTPAETRTCPDCINIKKRIDTLEGKGVTIILKVNATSLSTHEAFKGKKIPRIHWNCPHNGSNYNDQTLPEIISNFFKQCEEMQDSRHRVHITLAQPDGKKAFYQGYVYDITKAAREAGYSLMKKRKFGQNRYPGYQHTQTKSREKATITDQGMREFVFEKVDREQFEKVREEAKDIKKPERVLTKKLLTGLQERSKKKCTIEIGSYNHKNTSQWASRYHYECSTDDDSSDCGE